MLMAGEETAGRKDRVYERCAPSCDLLLGICPLLQSGVTGGGEKINEETNKK